MNLYIRIVDGQPFEHPIFEDNFLAAFPDVDINNLPPEFAKFERIAPPVIKPYEVYVGCRYENTNGVYRDVHTVRDMTDEEKTLKIANEKAVEHPEGWVFNEQYCVWLAPE